MFECGSRDNCGKGSARKSNAIMEEWKASLDSRLKELEEQMLEAMDQKELYARVNALELSTNKQIVDATDQQELRARVNALELSSRKPESEKFYQRVLALEETSASHHSTASQISSASESLKLRVTALEKAAAAPGLPALEPLNARESDDLEQRVVYLEERLMTLEEAEVQLRQDLKTGAFHDHIQKSHSGTLVDSLDEHEPASSLNDHLDEEMSAMQSEEKEQQKALANACPDTSEDWSGHAEVVYEWSDSIWEVSFFIGTTPLQCAGSVVVGFCLCLNVFLITLYIAEIALELTDLDYDDRTQQDLHLWRTQVAHDVTLRNKMSGESLASGICKQRLYTPFATLQFSMVSELKDYLNEPLIRLPLHDTSGSLLCSLVLITWYLFLLAELRSVAEKWFAFLNVPLKANTQFDQDPRDSAKFLITSISMFRFLVMSFILMLRFVVVLFLGLFGTRFLASETDLEEMILNAVALEVVLHMDKVIYAAMLPRPTKARLRSISPISYQMPLIQTQTVCGFSLGLLLLCGVWTGAWFEQLNPHVEHIKANYDELCGGVNDSSYEFVVAVDAIGIPWAASTQVTENVRRYAESAVEQAVQFGFPTPDPPLTPTERFNKGIFMQVQSPRQLEASMVELNAFAMSASDWSLINPEDIREVVGWDELNILLGKDDFGDGAGTVYNNYIQHLLGLSGPVSCAEVSADDCHTHGRYAQDLVFRKLCPTKCGCDDPLSGTVSSPYSRSAAGGFAGCTAWTIERGSFVGDLTELPCADTQSRTVFSAWVQGVGNAPSTSNDGLLLVQLMAAFDSGGCPYATNLTVGTSMGTSSNICTETSLPAICPVSCGCDPRHGWSKVHARETDFCPYACAGTPPCMTIFKNHSRDSGLFGPHAGLPCIFPFKYKGKIHHACTTEDWEDPWCAVTILADDRRNVHWGDCAPGC